LLPPDKFLLNRLIKSPRRSPTAGTLSRRNPQQTERICDGSAHHGSWCIRCFGTKLASKPCSAIPRSVSPHSLSRLVSEVVGLVSKCLHAVFYGGERLLTHHSVLLSKTAQHVRLVVQRFFWS
jgi:hypothetical protein